MVRKVIFWAGWLALLAYAGIFVWQAWYTQDLPPISIVKWGVLAATVILIYMARNRDEVVAHHLPH